MLGVDYGSHRVGSAISDSLRMTAQPLEVISRPAVVERIGELISELDIKEIVMGLPLGLSGKEGPAARLARSFRNRDHRCNGSAGDLSRREIYDLDRRVGHAVGQCSPVHTSAKYIDKVAAAVILQAFLDRPADEPFSNHLFTLVSASSWVWERRRFWSSCRRRASPGWWVAR